MDLQSLLQIQSLAFPLISAFGGPDIPREFIQPGAVHLHEGATVLREAADVLDAAGTALEDGRLDMTEIDKILAEWNELKAAAVALIEPELPTT